MRTISTSDKDIIDGMVRVALCNRITAAEDALKEFDEQQQLTRIRSKTFKKVRTHRGTGNSRGLK